MSADAAKVVVTGGAGFLGRLIVHELAARRGVEVVAFDSALGDDVNDAAAVQRALGGATSVVHLASMVSAECERDFDGALRVNLGGLRVLLDAARRLDAPPRFVFTSSVAVFGEGTGGDGIPVSPRTTYGMTKAAGELLVQEYTRKGFVDGRVARLPTVVIRPGRPNAAASGFASGMFREPLAGVDSVVPVERAIGMVLIGVRAAVAGLLALHDLDASTLGPDRVVSLPALEVDVAGMLDALERVDPAARRRVTVAPDPAISAVVASWPGHWHTPRAAALGLPADRSLDEVIEEYRRGTVAPAS